MRVLSLYACVPMMLVLVVGLLLLLLLLQGLDIQGEQRLEALRNGGTETATVPPLFRDGTEDEGGRQQLLLAQSVWQLCAVDAHTHERL